MSNIQNNLARILSAVYGRDVRQSIHDAIKQCYDDVSNPSLNTEAFKTVLDASFVSLTQADYDELVKNNTDDPNKYYIIVGE